MRTPSERIAAGLPEDLPKDRKLRQAVEQAVAETAAAEKPKKAKKAAAPVDLSTFSTDGDLVDIWERRMLNPDQRQTRPIRVHTPGMHLRWINLSSNGRYQRARYEEGWVPVLQKELVDEREIYGVSYTIEGFVCRGEKQQEMLMKIPEAVWKKIRARKIELARKDQRQIRDKMMGDGAKYFQDKYGGSRGEEVASTLDNFKGTVKFGVEQVEPEPGDLDPVTEEPA